MKGQVRVRSSHWLAVTGDKKPGKRQLGQSGETARLEQNGLTLRTL